MNMGVPRRSPDKVMIRPSQPDLLLLGGQSTSIDSLALCLSFLTPDGSVARVR